MVEVYNRKHPFQHLYPLIQRLWERAGEIYDDWLRGYAADLTEAQQVMERDE